MLTPSSEGIKARGGSADDPNPARALLRGARLLLQIRMKSCQAWQIQLAASDPKGQLHDGFNR